MVRAAVWEACGGASKSGAMPDRRKHRGPHPQDAALFGPEALPRLRAAAADLSWLLTRGYATPSSLKLVGDRHQLDERQRNAVQRYACSDQHLRERAARRLSDEAMRGCPVWIDGYNVLTTVEAALSGALVLAGRDGAYRDLASMHGSYKKVEETLPAITLVGEVLAELGAGAAHWFFDSPVSNSGRLKALLREAVEAHGWDWEVSLVLNPDPVLSAATAVVASADSAILDRCPRWHSLARAVVERRVPEACVLDLAVHDE